MYLVSGIRLLLWGDREGPEGFLHLVIVWRGEVGGCKSHKLPAIRSVPVL